MCEYRVKKPMFGKEVGIVVRDVDADMAEDIVNQVYHEGIRLSKIFNFYSNVSELSMLNKKRKLVVSEELLEVIEKAIEFSVLTEGEYDITLGNLFKERKDKQPEHKPSCSYKDIEIKGNEITLTNSQVLIDLGSIAKGYIVDKMSAILKDEGLENFIVDGRGDLVISGKEIIGIQHPRKEGVIEQIELMDCAVATSGDYNQNYGGFEKSHILNTKEYISITVIAPNLTLADVYATAFFVSNKKNRQKLLKDKNVKIMTIDRNLNIKYFNDFERFLIEK